MSKRKRNSRAARKLRKAARRAFAGINRSTQPPTHPSARCMWSDPMPGLYYTTEPHGPLDWISEMARRLAQTPPTVPPTLFVSPAVFAQLHAAYERDAQLNRALKQSGIPVEQWPALQSVANVLGVSMELVLSNLEQLRAAQPLTIDVHPRHMMTMGHAYHAAWAAARK